MAVKLGELLIHKGLLTLEQLEEALQAQVIFGGKLGTILNEMGLIQEDKLSENLATLLHVPCVKPGQLQNIPTRLIHLISAATAGTYQAIPIALEDKQLTIAMADPHDLNAIDAISSETGFLIRPVLALEVRLIYALEKYYNIQGKKRYIAPPLKLRNELSKAPELHMPEASKASDGEGIETIEELVDEVFTFETACKALVNASNRDEVAEAVMSCLGDRFWRVALFMVVAGQITGWKSFKANQPIPAFDQFQMPANIDSVLRTALESKSFFLGPVPQTDTNEMLMNCLGPPLPKTVLILPLSIYGRVVSLIYVDDPNIDLSETVSDIQKLANKAILAFEVLILKNKILRA